MNATCPWCQAPRDVGPTCPRCGANYAKAEMIKSQGRAPAAPPAPSPAAAAAPQAETVVAEELEQEEDEVEDPHREWKLCAVSVPLALLAGVLLHATELGRWIARTLFAMPVHELGHAVTAWFCGYGAAPGLWFTRVEESRSFFMVLFVLAGLGFLIYRGYRARKPALLGLGAALLALQALGTLWLSPKAAKALIQFGGDGTGMVLAAALMASFFFGKNTQLYRNELRWGLAFMGGVAFVDMFSTWWVARSDFGAIPFGEVAGHPSDAVALVDVYGWETKAMVQRFVATGIGALAALAAVWIWGVWRAKQLADREQG